jgi:hypothetical protein
VSGPRACVVAALWLSIAGCGSKGPPAQPQTQFHSLSGRVRVSGGLRDGTGSPTGTRTLVSPDSVSIFLVKEGVLSESTRAVAGRYSFPVNLGTYVAFARVVAGAADSTFPLHLHNTDLVFPDTLQVGHAGDLSAYPNPFTAQLHLDYALAAGGSVRVRVITLGGTPVKTLLDRTDAAGLYSVSWDARDEGGQVVPTGSYWAILESAGEVRRELVFKEP